MVNGEQVVVPEGLSVPGLLARLGVRPGSAVVERNGVALTPSEATGTVLADGDVLEVVRAVAGG